MQNSTGGRHRKPRESMTSRLWWVFASAVAWTLCQVIGAPARTEPIRRALPPAPRKLELGSGGTREVDLGSKWAYPDQDELARTLVRPYLLRV